MQKKFKAETTLASILSETSEALIQGGSIRQQIEKLNAQASDSTKNTLESVQKKMDAILGASGGFFAPPSPEVTLSRVNGQAGTLYGEVWQADAEPTSPQMEAMATTDHDAADVMKRWNEFKTSDLPALNRQLREANAPEIQLESNLQSEEPQADEE